MNENENIPILEDLIIKKILPDKKEFFDFLKEACEKEKRWGGLLCLYYEKLYWDLKFEQTGCYND